MAVFASEIDYINAQDAKDQIAAYTAAITALSTTVMTTVAKANVQEYRLSDGQTDIRKTYRNPKEVLDMILVLRRLRQLAINDITSQQVRLVSSPNFIIDTPWGY